MKYLIIPLLFSVNFCFAQQVIFPIDSLTGKVVFTDIVKVDSVSTNELYKRARAWFTETYKSSKDVIQDADAEAHSISGKASIEAHYTIMGSTRNWGYVYYYISIICKDGKYKYIISDFYHEGTEYDGKLGLINNTGSETWRGRKKDYERVALETYNNTLSLIASLKEYMNKKLPSNSEW